MPNTVKYLDLTGLNRVKELTRQDTHNVATALIAPDYSPSSTYKVGDAVIQNNLVYVCVADINTPEVWNAAHWQRGMTQVTPVSDTPQNQLVLEGYYFNSVFWKEEYHINRLPNRIDRLYRDIPSEAIYLYVAATEQYIRLTPLANASTAGVTKLYNDLGNNTDGTITQSKLTAELARKVEIETSHISTDERLDIIVNS